MPLSLFMILNGLSYSAVSVAQDATLRRSIRKNVNDMKFLESIGTAQMEQELQKRVLDITKQTSETMTEETWVQPTLSEDEVKQYLHEVLQEVKARKTISKIDNHILITESLYNILPLSIQSLIPLWFVETRTLASRSLYFADGKYCSIFESNFLQLLYNLLF